jgi:hypothetical protein
VNNFLIGFSISTIIYLWNIGHEYNNRDEDTSSDQQPKWKGKSARQTANERWNMNEGGGK